MERVLKTQENRRWLTERERGSVDVRQLARLATSPNFRKPFKQQTKTDTSNVAVQILVDMSGSMSRRMETAKQTAAVLAESLKDLNIEFEVTGFHTSWGAGNDRGIPRGIYNRTCENMEYFIFKEFGSTNLSGIERLRVGSQNVDPEAVQWAGDRLAMRQEKRKIMFVLSDGMPAANTSDSRILGDQLRRNIKQLSKFGIETIGIGIQSDAVSRFYPDFIIVNELKELPGKAMAKLSKIITKIA